MIIINSFRPNKINKRSDDIVFCMYSFPNKCLINNVNKKLYTGCKIMITPPSAAKTVIARENPISYSDST